jgi:valyl-tRNA synthetase
MPLEKRYQPETMEPAQQRTWAEAGVYEFDREGEGAVYAIDTPPPTVSGKLHLGHVYSYSHADFMARFFRMQGRRVFYPMGFDDNGLPTEQLVERQLGKTAREVGRQAFIDACLEISDEAEAAYEALWRRLGLSIDWRYRYRTIDDHARRISQRSFIDLFEKGLVYQKEAPTIWCPRCQTAIAQADLVDIERESEFVHLRFDLQGGGSLEIATTRPELLPACAAVFVHPEDPRYTSFVGKTAIVPLFGQKVPVLADPLAEPDKGTGAVMCCTFGDQMDIIWWRTHGLPLVEAIDSAGRMTEAAGDFAGMTTKAAQAAIKTALEEQGYLVGRIPTVQSIRAHERDDVPVEYLSNRQWFIRILDDRETWLALGDAITWHPDYMKNRYTSWVENLNWDWCISRQRYYGVPFPLWYCADCGKPLLPSVDRLPVDPLVETPDAPCPDCGSDAFVPEKDVLDTWATSSMTPQIVTRWLEDQSLFKTLFPMTLRPQAHEIIRTWTFYTIVKAHFHFEKLPWEEVLISGWGIAGEGMGKISKSRGGGPMPPMEMLEKYSADAVRYWAASTSTGKDAVINEEKVETGQKLVTKIWNLARFSERFLEGPVPSPSWKDLTAADRWILSALQDLIGRVTDSMEHYDYSFAKSETEKFLWVFADNYLEMAKGRLYSEDAALKGAAQFTLGRVLLTLMKLFAPFLPHITEKIYQNLFLELDMNQSIHGSTWPIRDDDYFEAGYFELGSLLTEIASAVRRFKSDQALSLGTPLEWLVLDLSDEDLKARLRAAVPDLKSVTRAEKVQLGPVQEGLTVLPLEDERLKIAVWIAGDQAE